MFIGTNISSLKGNTLLQRHQFSESKYLTQLSSGKRINRASDDAAGSSISSRLDTQLKGTKQGVRNAEDMMSMLQVYEGASSSISSMLHRMRELALQSKTGTYADDDRLHLNEEFTLLKSTIDSLITKTTFNGRTLFAAGIPVVAHVGPNATDSFVVDSLNYSLIRSDLTISIATASDAGSAIQSIDQYLEIINDGRTFLGSIEERLEHAIQNLETYFVNATASKSRMTDADMAEASSELAKHRLLKNASIAMIAQSNQSPSAALPLFQ